MADIIRWNPVRDIFNLQDEINKLFGNYGGRDDSLGWAPAVDIQETESGYSIKVDLPGIKKEDIKLSVENNVMSISGERKDEKEEKGKNYLRKEKSYGSFFRSFALPHAVDSKNIKASYADGVLSVDIPKAEEAKPKEIKIEVK